MSKQTCWKCSRAPCRVPIMVQSPGNTPTGTFLYSAAATEDPQATTTAKEKALQIQNIQPTPINALAGFSADTDSVEDECEPEDEPESKSPSPYVGKPIRQLKCMYQKVYDGKDTKDFAHRWQGFALITPAIDKGTQVS